MAEEYIQFKRIHSDCKELVWKELCGRLPYGVRCYVPFHNEVMRLTGQRLNYLCFHKDSFGLDYSHEIEIVLDPLNSDTIVRPYLRPMSSMTKKEYETFPIPYSFDSFSTWNNTILSNAIEGTQILIGIDEITEIIDWLNAHHFDYRGLIERGLAIEAPEGMYETQDIKNQEL